MCLLARSVCSPHDQCVPHTTNVSPTRCSTIIMCPPCMVYPCTRCFSNTFYPQHDESPTRCVLYTLCSLICFPYPVFSTMYPLLDMPPTRRATITMYPSLARCVPYSMCHHHDVPLPLHMCSLHDVSWTWCVCNTMCPLLDVPPSRCTPTSAHVFPTRCVFNRMCLQHDVSLTRYASYSTYHHHDVPLPLYGVPPTRCVCNTMCPKQDESLTRCATYSMFSPCSVCKLMPMYSPTGAHWHHRSNECPVLCIALVTVQVFGKKFGDTEGGVWFTETRSLEGLS